MLAASRALFCFVPAVVVAPGGSLFLWLAVPVGGVAVFFILAPCGAILSTLLPKTMDLNRLGQAGKPHPGASLLGMLCMLVGAGPVLALGAAALFLLHSPAAAFLMVAGWAGVAAVISIPLYRVAEGLLARRRENLALVAQGR